MDVLVADGRPALVVAIDVPDLAAAAEWLAVHGTALRAALEVHGSLMIRGLPIGDTADFAVARDLLLAERVAYREKATPRSDFGDDVFSSTDFPATQPIGQHNENSYTLDFPGLLLFGCLVAPETGGATTVADSREVLSRLPAELVDRFRVQGWELRRSYHPYVSLPWSTAFGMTGRDEVEEYCASNVIALRWTGEDGLVTSQRRPATIRHPATGEEVWFNHVAFWNEYTLDPDVREVLTSSYGSDGLPFQTRYGDGGTLGATEIEVLNAAYDAATRRESWQQGDLLLVDNILSSHGREAFTGDRRIVVAMGQPRSVLECSPSVPPALGSLGA